MPRKAAKPQITKAASSETPLTLRVIVEPNDNTAMYYANYIEVAHSIHEFALNIVRVPTKLSSETLKQATATKELLVSPEIQILLPPTIIAGLIEALQKQKTAYESIFGKIQPRGGLDE